MSKLQKRRRNSARSGDIGAMGQLIIALLVVIFLVSGGASIANQYLGFIDLSWLHTGQRGDQTGLILGAIALVIGFGVLLWRWLGGPRSRWAAKVLGIRSINDIYAFSPGQFEEFVGFLFHRMGYEARVVGHTGDEGIDIELRRAGDPSSPRIVAQCKRYRGSVGQPIVREFYGSFAERATEGYLVTTGTFTDPAREWAQSRPLHLVDGRALMQWTEKVASELQDHPALSFLTR
jgi:restriction system protein